MRRSGRPVIALAVAALVAACQPNPQASLMMRSPNPSPTAASAASRPIPSPSPSGMASAKPSTGADLAWERHDQPAHTHLTAIAFSGRAFLAFGSDPDAQVPSPRLWRSADGSTWKPDHLSDAFSPVAGTSRVFAVTSLAASGSRLVAVGASTLSDGSLARAAAWVSNDDGATWRPADVGGADDASMLAVAHTPSGWVAVGADGQSGPSTQLTGIRGTAAWTSSDGSRWTRVETASAPAGGLASQLALGTTGLVASGDLLSDADAGAARWASADGSAWTPLAQPDLARASETIAAGTAVLAGSDRDRNAGIWSGPDGADLQPVDLGGLQPPNGVTMSKVGSAGPCWVVAGVDARADVASIVTWSSADTRTWNLQTIGSSNVTALAAGGGRVVMLGDEYLASGSTQHATWVSSCR
jgi:hypothetical protein